MKKILALLLCIPFILLACVSCGKKERDFSKMFFNFHDSVDAKYGCTVTPETEKDFNEYLDHLIENRKKYDIDMLYMNIYFSEGSYITDDELKTLNYCYCERYNKMNKIEVHIKFNDINRESIMNLSANKNVTSISMDCGPIAADLSLACMAN